MKRIVAGGLALLIVVVAAAYLWPVPKIGQHAYFAPDPAGGPEIIAHRGGAGLRPENTIWSFSAGEALGADALEGDVHLTADGHLVLLHDPTLDRTTDTAGAVSELTLAEIQSADAGAGFGRGGARPYAGLGLKVPAAEEALMRFSSSRWVLELKQDSAAAAQTLCSVIRRLGAEARVLVGSRHHGALRAFRAACPAVATSMSGDEVLRFHVLSRLGLGKWMRTPAVALQIPEIHEDTRILTRALLKAAKARGYRVQVWTVDDPADLDRLAAMGVDGLITNRVDLAMEMRARRARDASPCDIDADNADDAGEDCARAWMDANIGMNEIQAVGTHNSYKQAISDAEMALVREQSPDLALSLDYAHRPIPEQLDMGMRQLELDLYHDPEGGRYADPLGPRIVAAAGGRTPPFDRSPLEAPGLKVLHVQDIDYRSSCPTFKSCLILIREWSLAHPEHVPILILLNIKEAPIPVEGAVAPLPFDAAAFDGIDAQIREIFVPRHVIRPDEVRGGAHGLREGVRAGHWPVLGRARGRLLFALEAPPSRAAAYAQGHPSLEDRVLFINAPANSPAAGYMTLNDPVEAASRILSLVRQGYLIRTRADADTLEARAGDNERQVAAFLSGAQYISTDYPVPDARFGEYHVRLPGGTARCNPVLAAGKCGGRPVE